MPGSVFLRGDAVTLRTVEEEDLDYLQSLVNDPDVRRGTGFDTPVNGSQERDWFENGASSDDSVDLIVAADGDAVGSISIHPVDHPAGKAELGVFVDPDHWGDGHATDAARTIVDYAFDELRKHRIVARLFAYNDASRRVWEKLGFRHEATFDEAAFCDGEYVDVELYAVLEHEWRDG